MKFLSHILWLPTCLFFLFCASFASANTMQDIGDDVSTHPENPPVAIRGADLDDNVTRIVIDGMPANGYKLKPANNKLHILFTEFQWSFLKDDLAVLRLLKNIKNFTMLKRDEQTVFTVVYSCNCQADVYKWRNQKIIIDIYGLDAVENPTKTRRWLEAQKNKLKQQKLQEKDQAEVANTSNEEKIEKPPSPPKAPPEEQDFSFRSQLERLIAAAEVQGVVKFKDNTALPKELNKGDKPKIPDAEKSDDKADIASAPELKPEDPLYFSQIKTESKKQSDILENQEQSLSKNVTLSSKTILSIDDTEQLLPGDENIFKGARKRCLPDTAFVLPPNNPATETFYTDLTKYRSQVIGEFDRTDPEMSLNLAYHYISYGLGEEAINTLDSFGAPEHRGYIARSMAELLTSAPPSMDSMFSIRKDCRGVHGLWAAYYFYRIGNEKRAALLSDFPEAIEALATFPIVLQRHIGTALALNLVRKGSYDMADAIISEIAKHSTHFDHSVLLVRGLIDAKNGFSDRALGTLEDVMNQTTGLDQQMAGLSLSELKLAMNVPLSVRDISALEELVFLKSKEYVGAQALALIAEHESRFGNFYRGFKRLSKNIFKQKGIKDPVMIKAEQLFRRLAISGESVDNPDNLRIYYEFPNLLPDDPALHIGFAKQLYKLGHTKPAYDIMSMGSKIHYNYYKEHDQTYFMGQLLFDLGKYAKAAQIMNKPYESDLEYMSLKAEALHRSGQHQEAYMLLNKFDDVESDKKRARFALAAREWAAAKQAFEDARLNDDDIEHYFGAKASGYMGGFDYPGNANEYENDIDVIFHQKPKQASGIIDVVKETDHLISLIEDRYETVRPTVKIEAPSEILQDG
ncbi:MAG: hypothetical protein AAF621_00915 [Pseudomonadota bacterium]